MEPTLEINDRVLVLKDALTPINIESGDIVKDDETDHGMSQLSNKKID